MPADPSRAYRSALRTRRLAACYRRLGGLHLARSLDRSPSWVQDMVKARQYRALASQLDAEAWCASLGMVPRGLTSEES